MLRDIIVIGSGPAGYSAGIYAARAGRNPLLITGMQQGGQLMITSEIENYPGFASISGPELMENMRLHAESAGVEMVMDVVSELNTDERPFKVKCESGVTYEAKSVIIATGASAKWLGLESETKYRGRGVSACATCDGFFFRNKTVAIIGGGNTAIEEGVYLANLAKKVYIIHRGSKFRAEKIMQDRLLSNDNVEVFWNCTTQEILGDEKKVTGIRLKNSNDNSVFDVDLDGVFVAIGYAPNTSVFGDKFKTDEWGYIVTEPWSTLTSVNGIFAAGDVRDHVFRQAITSAGQGCMAALEADRYIAAIEADSHIAER